MLEYELARPEQVEAFLRLTRDQAADYLERTLELMGMTWEQFSHLFRTVGQVYAICRDGHMTGFYWVEERGNVLHLHGLILKESSRGQGIGTQVLHELEARHGDSISAIELGVHKSNRRARKLYARLGYETVQVLEDLGFEVMRKQLAKEPAASGP
jgi:ribosomal protein S18 acetylase RimI-like enzyme